MRLRRKVKGILLITGSLGTIYALWQSFLFQAAFPWPSKTPSPDNVNLSTRAKVIQLSPGRLFSACNVPPSWKSIGLVQGPLNIPSFTLNIPPGITIALERLDVHASFHAFAKAYMTQVTKISKQLINSTSDNIDVHIVYLPSWCQYQTLCYHIFSKEKQHRH